MVSKEIISKSLDTSIKNHNYFSRIKTLLRNVTDTKEEYEMLRDDVLNFYQQTKKLDHENLILRDSEGNIYNNVEGSESSVEYTEEMESVTEGFMGHNHPIPNGSSCVQSANDLYLQVLYLHKYSWTIGKDGFMITKMGWSPDSPDENEVVRTHRKVLSGYFNDFLKSNDDKLKPLYEKYPNWNNLDSFDSDYFQDATEDMYQKYLRNHTSDIINDLDKNLKKTKYGTWECHYAKNGR